MNLYTAVGLTIVAIGVSIVTLSDRSDAGVPVFGGAPLVREDMSDDSNPDGG